MSGRFDYVKYDKKAVNDQGDFKNIFVRLENEINTRLKAPRAQALALTKLEEAYMWVGKAIRDEQVVRNSNTELQEDRKDS